MNTAMKFSFPENLEIFYCLNKYRVFKKDSVPWIDVVLKLIKFLQVSCNLSLRSPTLALFYLIFHFILSFLLNHHVPLLRLILPQFISFLGVFTKSEKMTISFVMSVRLSDCLFVRLSVRMKQFGRFS